MTMQPYDMSRCCGARIFLSHSNKDFEKVRETRNYLEEGNRHAN